MEAYFVPEQMKQLAGQSIYQFGYDQQGTINYSFNNLGFRTGYSTGVDSINLIGNSIAFGIGLDYDQTFGKLAATSLNKKINNYSFGCYRHENHDHLANIKLLAKQDNNDIFIIQINNLDRQRIDSTSVITGNTAEFCQQRFIDYFDQVSELLKHKSKIFLYWDEKSYDIPKSIIDQILIVNKFHVDSSLPTRKDTFGVKSNQIISKVIANNLAKLT